MAGGVKMTFPAFDDKPELVKYYGTRRFEVDGEVYERAIQDMPLVRQQSEASAQDTAEFFIVDPDNERYGMLKEYEDVLEDVETTVKECLLTELGIFESEIVHNGFIESFGLSDSSMGLNISSISDMSRSGLLVGGRILTQRYCGWKFNKSGMLSPLIDPCGWQTAQGGNPLFCSHKLKGTDGCEDHNNAWRFGAVEALTTAEVSYPSGGGIGGGGWDYGNGPGYGGGGCWLPETNVLMYDGSVQPIWKVKKGGAPVMSFDDKGRMCAGEVDDAMTHIVPQHLEFDLGHNRILKPSLEQPFKVGPDEYKPAMELADGDHIEVWHDKWMRWMKFGIEDAKLVDKRVRVHNLTIRRTHTYIVVVDNLKIGVHNKAMFEAGYVN